VTETVAVHSRPEFEMKQIKPLEIGIPVIDLDTMLDFYQQVLSCEEVRRADIPAELTQALTSGEAGYVNVWLRTPGGEVIKLFRAPTAPARDPARRSLGERTGIAYLTLYCSDLEEVLAIAEAHGGVLRSDRSLLSGSIGLKLAFFEDPEGNVIELVEPVA
jgi:catechol 2,3-dioxygenase-like lactoylglutathione lyase family enzyme